MFWLPIFFHLSWFWLHESKVVEATIMHTPDANLSKVGRVLRSAVQWGGLYNTGSWKQWDHGGSSCMSGTSLHHVPPTAHVSCNILEINTPLSKRFTHAKQCSLELSHRTHTLLFLFPALLLTIITQVAEGTCNSIPATFFGPVERTGPASSLGMALRTNCWQLSSSQGSLQG